MIKQFSFGVVAAKAQGSVASKAVVLGCPVLLLQAKPTIELLRKHYIQEEQPQGSQQL